MPFTPGHPAIVLPFVKSRYFSATGLIVGSMSPDFEYFFRLSVNGLYGHTVAGLFYFNIPVTFLLSILFHTIVKRNLISNLPEFFQRRFQDVLNYDFITYLKKNWIIFLVSAAIGTGSHIFWDSFTHNDRFFVRLFSDFYDSTYVYFHGANYPLFYVLQQVSTAVGLTVVFLYIILKKPQDNFQPAPPRIGYWIMVFAIAITVLRIRFLIHPSDYNLGNVVVTGISGLLVGVLCCGLVRFRSRIHFQKSLNG
jgi:hypothetical protein